MNERSIPLDSSTQEVFRNLFAAIPYLDPSQQEPTAAECQILSELMHEPALRVAFLAPFNSGKSTLINALVGQEILPTGVIPTTACPIIVKHGDVFKTVVTYRNGLRREFEGSAILDSVAVLNEEKSGVKSTLIEVWVPWFSHFKNIEFIDLPGTEDQEILDETVKDNLLKADVIIVVIYALKIFSQPEREKIREWLLKRGIDTVVFVLNFSNLNRERDLAWKDAYRVVRAIQTDLPLGSRRLFRVDALPAFKARHGSNSSYKALANSGFIRFEAALRTLLGFQRKRYLRKRHLRLTLLVERVQNELLAAAMDLRNELQILERQRNQVIQLGKAVENRLRSTFHSRVSELSQWLERRNLLTHYQYSASEALKSDNFKIWENNSLRPGLEAKVASINEIDREIAEIYKLPVNELQISLLATQTVYWPSQPTFNLWGKVKNFFTDNEKKAWEYYYETRNRVASGAADDYLTKFSQKALGQLTLFSTHVKSGIRYNPPPIPPDILEKQNHYSELNGALGRLNSVNRMKKREMSKIRQIQAYLWYLVVFIKLHYRYLTKSQS